MGATIKDITSRIKRDIEGLFSFMEINLSQEEFKDYCDYGYTIGRNFPFSYIFSPSASISPPSCIPAIISQWTVDLFNPPVCKYDWPTAI